MTSNDWLIVSRHAGAVEWLFRTYPELAGSRVVPAVTPEDVAGRDVVGNLPASLASKCRRYVSIEFRGAPPRGAEYGADEMDAGGAYLAEYAVRLVDGNVRSLR